MPEARAAPPSFAAGRQIDIGELIRQVSEILAADQALSKSIDELCTLLAHAFSARSIAIVLDEAEGAVTTHRYDVPIGLAGESADFHESIPLQIGQTSIGALTIAPRAREGLSAPDHATLETCARYIAVGLRNARLAHTNDSLERLIEVDPLTEVGNRRRFDQRIDSEWRRCGRNRQPLSVVMIDVDYFKEFNDRYGHVAGDACLQRIAKAISGSTLRASDVVTRYGGEEFAVLLAETDLAGAVAVAENIRLAVERLQIPHSGTSLGSVSISAGIATLTPAASEEWGSLVEAADLALYRAKSAGRNRIVAGAYVSEGSVVQRRAVVSAPMLPIPLTTFLGRRKEMAQIERLLRSTRVLSLVGPGGVGKTRLALEVVASHAGQRPVAFVDLAPIGCAIGVAPAILQALGVDEENARSTEETICSHLERSGGIVVLDNCEHLLRECSRIAEQIARTTSGVTIIATSREPLGLRGEGVYRIPTLEVPPKGAALTAREALDYDAVHLFADRAKLVDPAFALTAENVQSVARICRRLDGIPLAIELAAPRLRVMTLEQIERGLDARFTLLTGGNRTALPRQKTLYALIRWGFDLLEPQEQRALERLSVLVGKWTIEAAAAVIGEAQTGLDGALDLVASLVDKSLLIAEPRGSEMRYCALESTRAFAYERLLASGSAEETSRAHARYFAEFTKQTLSGNVRDDAKAFETIRAQHGNIVSALHWTLSHDAALGLDMVEHLWTFWQGSGRFREAQRWLRRALDVSPRDGRSRLLSAWLAKATINLGDAAGTLERAIPLIDECNRENDDRALHLARRMAATAHFQLDDLSAARGQIEAMLACETSNVEERALSLGYLAYIEMHEGNDQAALRLLEEAAVLELPPGLRSWVDENYGIALFLTYRIEEAIERLRASLAYEDGVRNGTRSALASLTLGFCWLETENPGLARVALRRALREPTLATQPEYLCACFDAFVLLAATSGNDAATATLLGFADAERRRRGVRKPYRRVAELCERAAMDAKRRLGDAAFGAAVQRGGWLALEAATSEALAL
jgi:diguanylate cyclase (GGDEF)-like protein